MSEIFVYVSILLKPNFKDQMVRLPFNGSFWEGSISVTGMIDGKKVTGKAFGELIHRFKAPKLKLKQKLKSVEGNKLLSLNWKVLNPDEGLPLKYSVRIYDNQSRTIVAVKDLKTTEYTLKLNKILSTHTSKKLSLQAEVTAYSIDQTIKSQIKGKIIKIEK